MDTCWEKVKTRLVRLAWKVPVKGEKSRGRQPRRWSDGLQKRLEEFGLKEEDAQGSKKCRSRIQAADPLKKTKRWKQRRRRCSFKVIFVKNRLNNWVKVGKNAIQMTSVYCSWENKFREKWILTKTATRHYIIWTVSLRNVMIICCNREKECITKIILLMYLYKETIETQDICPWKYHMYWKIRSLNL